MGTMPVVRAGAALAMAAVLLAGCSGSSGGGSDEAPKDATTTTSIAASSSTTGADAVTTTTAATGKATTTSAEPSNGLEPGDACSLEEGSPDCIDTDGDGEGIYLIGGADCIATAASPEVCDDTDGNGLAGTQ